MSADAPAADASASADRPVAFRNVARYVHDLDANVPLYEAIGFEVVRRMDHGMVVMQNDAGVSLVLHAWEDHKASLLDTALGLTIQGDVADARRYLEEAGFKCLREPEEGDEGFFFIYGDLDGNPVNLVGMPGHGGD